MKFLQGTLKTKFILALALILATLTSITLLVVQYRVQLHVRRDISDGLHNSVVTFQNLQQLRESTLESSATLLATLPLLKAVMTSEDKATIQEASGTFWNLARSQLFVLADRSGSVVALHTTRPGFTESEAQKSLRHSLENGGSRDWWFGDGRLFEVFLQRIYFGSPEDGTPYGIVAMGYEIDNAVASDVSRAASGEVAFQYDKKIVVSTLPATSRADFAAHINGLVSTDAHALEIQLGSERFLATSVQLSSENSVPVTLTVLKSFDEASAFLTSLNRWIVLVGVAGVLAGGGLVFFVATTFTRPLNQLVAGVRALEEGDFAYPLKVQGRDEVSALTSAFHRMRVRLQETQRQLLDAERLATIGRMASTISHDLRHPLTAILAYAEFLGEANLSQADRHDFAEEIRIAVNRMTDEISSLLGLSKQREPLHLTHGQVETIIERAIQSVRVLPDFASLTITFRSEEKCEGWFDPAKVERVMLNLLFNACEAVSPNTGKVEVTSRVTEEGIEIRVADNGPGIPESIRENLFQPFVSFGKEKGTGLGLTVVQKIMQDHGGEVRVERTDASGSTFKLLFPQRYEALQEVNL
jgi:signal transduction histidine kinase